MTRDEGNSDGLARLGLLAAALSKRALRVASGRPGEPAWTDGAVVFVDPEIAPGEQVAAVAVQAALLAAGSLDVEIVRRLKRRPALARRYLTLEGHRALKSITTALPPPLPALIDPALATRSDSPAASLKAALAREAITAPPDCFGSIRARRLLASSAGGNNSVDSRRREDQRLAELGEDEENADGNAADLFSSPVGGGGPLGRLLGQLLGVVRRLDGADSPGADSPTHATAVRRGPGAEISRGTAAALEEAAVERRGRKYPEWDHHHRRYLRDWCTVREVEPRPIDESAPLVPVEYGLRRPLARLAMGLDRCHRRLQGDEVDIDAAVQARIDALAGAAADEAIYIESLRRRRDLAVLILLDTSGSVAEPTEEGRTVHEQQRATAAALAVALHGIGDRVALYAYNSRGRSAVDLLPVKRFDENLDALAMRRLQGLLPGAYSRLGAAIRHGSAVLEERGGTSRRLLVVLSDGLAYDHGYEPSYGASDARRALAEARRRGTACLCLSMGAATDGATLRRVFGSAAHAMIPKTEQLPKLVGTLFLSALRSAEVPRQIGGWR